jgi:NitT/TauT family transport system ATP-binding protein
VQDIRFDRRFLELYREIWGALREEVEQAFSRQAQVTRARGGAS